MNAMLVKYLKDFSAPEPEMIMDAEALFGTGSDFDFPAIEDNSPPPVDLEALAEDARNEGYEAATVDLTARHDTEIATLMAVHAGEMDDLRTLFEKDIVRLVDERFTALLAQLETSLSHDLSALLLPIVEQKVVEASIADLASAILDMMKPDHGLSIVVRGPERLKMLLAQRLEGRDVSIRHVPEDGLDLTVDVDHSVISTRMAAWRDGLADSIAVGATGGRA